jgi:small-conductance mechanosensitive channel
VLAAALLESTRRKTMNEQNLSWLVGLRDWDFVLFMAGDSAVRISTLLKVLMALLLLIAFTRWLRGRTVSALSRTPLEAGTRVAVATLLQYALLVLGVSLIMQNVGLKLSAFGVLAGAFGVGLGFGLQNVISNFVSGLIVMIERPVRVGDRIEISGIEGDVVAINARSTVLRTPRGAAAIIPNQKFVTESVRNWAQGEGVSPLHLSFKLAQDQDPEAAIAALREATAAIGPALDPRRPEVFLSAMDAAGVTVEVLAWVQADATERPRLQSALLREVQRRVRTGALRLG